jgi:hypothetical protein
MNHVVIRDISLNGWEYGMLRSFEREITKETGAAIVDIPDYTFAPGYMHYFGHGMVRGKYRQHFPRQNFSVNADIAWCVLMGPENYRLDLYKNWQAGCKTKILYLYDTLPSQYPLIKRLFSNNTWDLLITSFNDAVDDLTRITGRKWHCAEQAADLDVFNPVPLDQRLIHFSSYGRRNPLLHDSVKDFCSVNGLYYDYTTHDARHPVADAAELYRQYAWHLSHSVFTFSWPVELTHPIRAGHLHPVTCRWFEAAAAGTVMLGQSPRNALFDTIFFEHMVKPVQLSGNSNSIYQQLELLWQNRAAHIQYAAGKQQQYRQSWGWNERVKRILSWLR